MDGAVLVRLILDIDHAVYGKFQIPFQQESEDEVPAHKIDELIVPPSQPFGILETYQAHFEKCYQKEGNDVTLDENQERF